MLHIFVFTKFQQSRFPILLELLEVSQDDVQNLGFGVAQHLLDALFAPDATVLHAAIWHADVMRATTVDPDMASVAATCRVERVLDILCPARRRQAIFDTVRTPDRLIAGVPFAAGEHRTENIKRKSVV